MSGAAPELYLDGKREDDADITLVNEAQKPDIESLVSDVMADMPRMPDLSSQDDIVLRNVTIFNACQARLGNSINLERYLGEEQARSGLDLDGFEPVAFADLGNGTKIVIGVYRGEVVFMKKMSDRIHDADKVRLQTRWLVESVITESMRGKDGFPEIIKPDRFDDDFLIIKWIDGVSLKSFLDKKEKELADNPKLFFDLMSAITKLISKIHAHGIIHRDIKPENIMIDATGTPIIIDFGIAQKNGKIGKVDELIEGTIQYMGPEFHNKDQLLGPAYDVYALGVIFYEFLTGKELFKASTPIAIAVKHRIDPVPRKPLGKLPKHVQELILRMLEKDPTMRPSLAEIINFCKLEARYDEDAEVVAEAEHVMALAFRVLGERVAA